MTDISHLIPELRSTAAGKRRSAAILLGKSGNLTAIDPLVEALSDPHPGVRGDIVQALRMYLAILGGRPRISVI